MVKYDGASAQPREPSHRNDGSNVNSMPDDMEINRKQAREKSINLGRKKRRRVDEDNCATGKAPGEIIKYTSGSQTTNLVPFGGVPLASSLTSKRISRVKRAFKVLLESLEFVEEGPMTPSGNIPLCLRCQNCNSTPSCSFTRPLVSTGGHLGSLFEQILNAHTHVKDCPYTVEETRNIVSTIGTTNLGSSAISAMRTYCDFLISMYGMKDDKDSEGKSCVVFSECDYEVEEYSSKKLKVAKKKNTLSSKACMTIPRLTDDDSNMTKGR
eukprot:CAMPEP_0197234018 /NCGR_PEP_ID=MMETSP1429-20130617/1886_1 /TAXON_ID=49237 /ORGANISM="Chaetoceros  sp., Strain UNC1202" /LENGTH=268 /DNA_ID=CAMNT_0042692343 /DNA_START=1 /DNA_END=807 /DNA_ORIENTATION=-